MRIMQFSTNNNATYVVVTTEVGNFLGRFIAGTIALAPARDIVLLPAGSTQKARITVQGENGRYKARTTEPIVGTVSYFGEAPGIEAEIVVSYAEMMTPVPAEGAV